MEFPAEHSLSIEYYLFLEFYRCGIQVAFSGQRLLFDGASAHRFSIDREELL